MVRSSKRRPGSLASTDSRQTTKLLAALKPLESEASRRMRLSIARGLHKLDATSALKLIVATLQSLRKENGLEPKDRQIFYSVLIGKNKPWLLQLDLKTLKPAEAQLVALTAIECAAGANPPATVAVIRWAKPYQPLNSIPEPLQQELGKISENGVRAGRNNSRRKIYLRS